MFISCKKETCKNLEDVRLEIRIKNINLPAGCTSTAGYSATTGQPCNGAVQSDILVSATAPTYNVPILSFSMKAIGGVIDTRSIVLPYDGQAHLENIISHAQLYINNTLAGDVDLQSGLITFRGLPVRLDENIQQECTVVADILPATQYPIPTFLKFYLGSSYVDARDNNGDKVAIDVIDAPERSSLRLYCQSTMFVMGTPSYDRTTNTNGEVTSVKYYIPLSVMPSGSTVYVGQTAQLATMVSGSNALALVFRQSGAPTVDDVASIASITLSSFDAPIENNAFRIDGGTVKHFTITVILTTPATLNTSYVVVLKQFQTFTNTSLTTGRTIYNLLPVEQYVTLSQFINN